MNARILMIVGVLAAAFPSPMAVCSAQHTQHNEPPNVLLIVLDDVGVDKLQVYEELFDIPAYGTPVVFPPTPEISAISAAGVHFTRAYANPLCSPTRACLMTGRYPFRTGMGMDPTPNVLSPDEITIAEVLKGGFPGQPWQYECGAFGKWHLAEAAYGMHAVDQGFDEFAGTMGNVDDHFDWELVTAAAGAAAEERTQVNGSNPYGGEVFTASVVRQAASSWIAGATEPFFAYVAFNPPHLPFQVPPFALLSGDTVEAIEELEALEAGTQLGEGMDLTGTASAPLAYDWLLEAVDHEVGRLIDEIPAGKRANTTILILADNGTPSPVIQAPPFDPEHAKWRVFEQGTHVPLIANGRDVSTADQACDGLVDAVDVWRTIAALSGAQLPAGLDQFDLDHCFSFKNLLADPTLSGARPVCFVERFNPSGAFDPIPTCPPPPPFQAHLRALHDGTFKYMRLNDPTLVPPYQELAFDLSSDPLETDNLWHGDNSSTLPAIRNLKGAMIAFSGCW